MAFIIVRIELSGDSAQTAVDKVYEAGNGDVVLNNLQNVLNGMNGGLYKGSVRVAVRDTTISDGTLASDLSPPVAENFDFS